MAGVRDGVAVGAVAATAAGCTLPAADGEGVGVSVGVAAGIGVSVGAAVGAAVGALVGADVGVGQVIAVEGGEVGRSRTPES